MKFESIQVIHYLGEVYNDDIYKEILEQSHAEGSTDPNNANNCSAESPLASKNSDGYTPAHIAVQKLKLGLLEALVEVGAPIDVPDSNGETPLISAVLMDDVETASLLLMVRLDHVLFANHFCIVRCYL